MFDETLNERQGRPDKLQLLGLLGLMIIGAAFIYSATMASESARMSPLMSQVWMRQIVWCGIGIGAATALCFVSYHTLASWSMIGYWGSTMTLVAVLIEGIGTSHGWGAMRWIDLGPFQFQPSELAKLTFILALARFLSRPADDLRTPGTFWKAMAMMVLPFALIFKEPDLGSALVFVPTGFAMMLVAGVPRRYLFRLVALVGTLAVLVLVDVLFAPPSWQIKLEEYQRQRLLVFFGVDFAPANATPKEKERLRKVQEARSYQVRQAMISVGSGGMWGKGWNEGNQTALGFLPRDAAHNDFIFSVIAEEEGFVGSVMVITLYGVVLFTGLRIAGQARDRLGKLLAVGVVTLLFSHVFINIGMNIRLMPVTGIPLPLLSYGGTSVICSLIAMGMLQNVHLYRKGY